TGRSPPATRWAPRRRWRRSSPCQPISTATTSSTRCGPACSPRSAAMPRPAAPASERSRWPSTRPSASCSPAASHCETTRLASAHFDDRAELDRYPAPVDARPGLRDLHGLVDGIGVDQRIPAESLFGLDERPVGDAGRADGLRRRRRLQLVPAFQLPGRAPLLVPGAHLGGPRAVLRALRCRFGRGVHDQHHVLHACLLLLAVPCTGTLSPDSTNGEHPDPTRTAKLFP